MKKILLAIMLLLSLTLVGCGNTREYPLDDTLLYENCIGVHENTRDYFRSYDLKTATCTIKNTDIEVELTAEEYKNSKEFWYAYEFYEKEAQNDLD